MSVPLYDVVAETFLQFLPGVDLCLEKGREHYASEGKDPNELVEERLYPDMLPLHFQIVTLVHMSAGAITAAREGRFGAPDLTLAFDYDGLQGHARDALAQIQAVDADELNGLAEGKVIFQAGNTTLPFRTREFFLSFAIPHFYFHTTTAYGLLRKNGVPLGKADYLGAPRLLEGASS